MWARQRLQKTKQELLPPQNKYVLNEKFFESEWLSVVVDGYTLSDRLKAAFEGKPFVPPVQVEECEEYDPLTERLLELNSKIDSLTNRMCSAMFKVATRANQDFRDNDLSYLEAVANSADTVEIIEEKNETTEPTEVIEPSQIIEQPTEIIEEKNDVTEPTEEQSETTEIEIIEEPIQITETKPSEQLTFDEILQFASSSNSVQQTQEETSSIDEILKFVSKKPYTIQRTETGWDVTIEVLNPGGPHTIDENPGWPIGRKFSVNNLSGITTPGGLLLMGYTDKQIISFSL